MASFTLSLQHVAKKSDPSDSLPELVKRIHEQRGHFRNVSEEGLLDEINTAEKGHSDQQLVSEDDQDEQPEPETSTRLEEIYKTREDLRRYVAQAQNDALTALDFVSLLLSKDRPLQGGMSMSPLLKQMVPVGSLGYMKFQSPKQDASEAQKEERVAVGWNFKSLESTADRILQSAEKLEREIEKETNYWKQVLSISKRGWSLCRMPGERHTIGVRFGFAEAAPAFQLRDLAALRPDSKGDILVDLGLNNQPKAVRVRLQQGSKILGISKLPYSTEDGQQNVENHIQRVTDSQFEEELFFEMTREARTLLPHGIRVRNDTIIIPWQREASTQPKSILVDLVSPEEVAATEALPSDEFANTVALALRILLTRAYHLRYLRRTRPPPPLTAEKPPAPTVSIISPVLNNFQHQSAIESLSSLIMTLQNTALGPEPSNHSVEIVHHFLHPTTIGGSSTAQVDRLLSALTNPLTTTITTPVPLQSDPLKSPNNNQASPPPSPNILSITATTSLAAPIYGTKFTVSTRSASPSSSSSSSASDDPAAAANAPATTEPEPPRAYSNLHELEESLAELFGAPAALEAHGQRDVAAAAARTDEGEGEGEVTVAASDDAGAHQVGQVVEAEKVRDGAVAAAEAVAEALDGEGGDKMEF